MANKWKILNILKAHTNIVRSVGFNHDGTKIVSGSEDKTIRVWNVDTGECILTLKGHTTSVYSVGFNHDGTKIVSGSWDKTIRVWNVDTGECILILKGHTDWVTSVVFNHDGTKIVSGSEDNTIRVWNVDTGECILTLKGHTSYVYSVGFNHDGKKIVSGSNDNTIRIWNVDTGECILTLKGHTGSVYSVVFNHDGTKIVSGSSDNTIRVWNVDTGERILTLKGHTHNVYSVGFNHDGTKIVSGSNDRTIRVWNNNNMKPVSHGPSSSSNNGNKTTHLQKRKQNADMEPLVKNDGERQHTQAKEEDRCKDDKIDVINAETKDELLYTKLKQHTLNEKSNSANTSPVILPIKYLTECTLNWSDKKRLIGQGVFGKVYHAVDGKREIEFVVKRMNVSTLQQFAGEDRDANEIGKQMQEREIATLIRFSSNQYIVNLVAYTDISEGICLCYEYCKEGSLDKLLLDDNKAKQLTWKHRVRILNGMVKAINFLHNNPTQRCYHRDVKAGNICITNTFAPKLIDCGLAKFIPEGENRTVLTASNGRPGTPGYKCPKYESSGKFNDKSEMFSFGIVLLEVLTGCIQNRTERGDLYYRFFNPDPDDREEDLNNAFDAKATGNGKWPIELKKELYDLTKNCLKFNPKKRISFMTAMRQLDAMEKEYCEKNLSDKEIEKYKLAMAEAEKVKRFKDAKKKASEKECLSCYGLFEPNDDNEFKGIECSSNHFFCDTCFNNNVKYELNAIEGESTQALEDYRGRNGTLLCPHRSMDTGIRCEYVYDDYSISQHVSREVFLRYTNAKEEVAKYHEFTKMNDELNDIKRLHDGERKQLEARLQQQRDEIKQIGIEQDRRCAEELQKKFEEEERQRMLARQRREREAKKREMMRALPNARQCGHCGYGPIVNENCNNLATHHGERRGQRAINNHCPRCDWFERDWNRWPRWDGQMHELLES